ncbi:hypothetical protein E9993_19245 [Labilibacter sediminis]|nr:hypothetical protein E9993_19245 [Labilibacter sediminis]
MKSLQNKTLCFFTSTHQNDAMPHFSKALFYRAFNVHDEVLIHNAGLINFIKPTYLEIEIEVLTNNEGKQHIYFGESKYSKNYWKKRNK